MARSSPSFELDFFTTEKKDAKPPPVFQRRRSFRDIQGVITKMNPEVVKSVIANGALCSTKSSVSVPSTPNKIQTVPSSPLPLCDPKFSLCENNAENASPLTIFYNGTVAVFNVSPRQAQNVLKLAEEILPDKSVESSESLSFKATNLLESLNGDLPISRKNSLQRFLEKRKGRLTTLSPYYFPKENCYSRQSPFQFSGQNIIGKKN